MSVQRFSNPLRFVIYNHEADVSYRSLLEIHLSPLHHAKIIELWHPGKLAPGGVVDDELSAHLETAQIILVLISADLVAQWSARVSAPMRQLSKLKDRIVPVYVRACNWSSLPFSDLQVLPRDGSPIASHGQSIDDSVTSVIEDIRSLVRQLRGERHPDLRTVMRETIANALATSERERYEFQRHIAGMSSVALNELRFTLSTIKQEDLHDLHPDAALSLAGELLRQAYPRPIEQTNATQVPPQPPLLFFIGVAVACLAVGALITTVVLKFFG